MKFILFLFLLSFSFVNSQSNVKIMYYNVLNFNSDDGDRLDELSTIFNYYQPDLLVINELLSEDAGELILDSAIHTYHNNYQFAPFIDGPDTDNGLYYNTDVFSLIETNIIQTDLRDMNSYSLGHIENGDTIALELISLHLKASSGSANEIKRELECIALQNYLGDITLKQNVIVGGDFNFYDSGEPAFRVLIDDIQLIDPLGHSSISNNWHNNINYALYHTQSPRTTQFGGGANGGMDDRFDFMFVSPDIISGDNAVTYLDGSYTSLGNDGQHFNLSIIDPPTNTMYPDSVLQAIHDMSDHLPIGMSIEINHPSPLSNYTNSDNFKMSSHINDGILHLKLKSPISHSANFQVTDLQGKIILNQLYQITKGESNHQISIGHLSAGLYLLTESVSRTHSKLFIH